MAKEIIVNKFGGGILKNEYIKSIKDRILEQINDGYRPVIVVSAFPGVTDKLISLIKSDNDQSQNILNEIKTNHEEILQSLNISYDDLAQIFDSLNNDLEKYKTDNKYEDKIVSYGERLSATILTEYFKSNNVLAKLLLSENIPIITDNNFKDANINYNVSKNNVLKKFSENENVYIVSGFTGITVDNEITTLGRGGTDTTACFLGSCLNVYKIILWKNVGGVLSADPKIIKRAKPIKEINYMEAEEAGKIIHDKAIQYIKINNTKVEISSILNPKEKTLIINKKNDNKGGKIINAKKDLDLIVITDEKAELNSILSEVGKIFSKHQIEILLISNAKYSVQILGSDANDKMKDIVSELSEKFQRVEIIKGDMVFLVGSFSPVDVNEFNNLLIKMRVNVLISGFYYENCNRIEAVIQTNDINKIIRKLYRKFIK